MSDIFDHCLDAYEDMWNRNNGFVGRYLPEKRRNYSNCSSNYDPRPNNFVKDSTYYHTKYRFIKLIDETKQAYKFQFYFGERWIPKKLCKKLNKDKHTVYVWNKFDWTEQQFSGKVPELTFN